MRRILAALTLAALCVATGSAQKPATPAAQLGAIIKQAEADLDFEGAIPRYTRFIAENGKNAELTAKGSSRCQAMRSKSSRKPSSIVPT